MKTILERMTEEDAKRLRTRCKEYLYSWLKTGNSVMLVSYRTHFNLLNQYLRRFA